MKPYKTAVIFAGGKSSRMGQDKALLPFGRYNSLTEYQYHKLKAIFDSVYISSKEAKFDFACDVIQDSYLESSPLIGLLSIFEHLEEEEVFILSVDAPFVDEPIVSALFAQNKSAYHAIIAKSPSGVQPLCGLYHQSILPLLKAQYKEGNHRLQSLLNLAHTLTIDFEDDTTFSNLNHPKDYQKALVHMHSI